MYALRIGSKDIMLSSVFASLYVAVNILQMFSPAGNPSVFGPIGAIDIVFGSLANFLAAYAIMLLRKHRLAAYTVGSLIIAAIVGGGYLWLFFDPPSMLMFMPAPLAMFISIFLSSLIAIAGFGYAV
ncbi:QueT transporter family protein, partial [Candidatus Bathyarchaeota archaeon]|nr:QueT transporter family protein [Candidatus Bathyarchaeota archaeon]